MHSNSSLTRLASRLLLALSILLLTGLFVQPVRASNNAFVRVIHASPAAGNVDVFVDGNELLKDFPFGTVTSYLPLPAGSHRIQIAPTGKGIAGSVVNQLVTVQVGLPYTLAALGTAGSFALQSFVDNNLSAGNNAKVRVYHLSPNAGPVNVATAGKTPISSLSYKNATPYLSVPPGSYSFRVTATQAGATVPVSAVLNPGTINSVFAIGLFNGTPSLKFVVATIQGVPNTSNNIQPVAMSNALP